MDYLIRPADRTDLESIIELLADDPLGSRRENFQLPLPDSYITAFKSIIKDPNQELMVLDISKQVAGTFQLSFIPYLTYRGGIRAQIEGVRISKEYRGMGFGRTIMQWAIERSREKGAHLIQLTSDKKRPEAIEFYRSLGFEDSHEGFKLHF